MRDLEAIRADVADALNAATRDLHEAARSLATDDPQGAPNLARMTVLLGAVATRASVVMTPGLRPATASPESWLLAAGRLHEALSDVGDGVTDLWYAALDAKQVPVPAILSVSASGGELFRHLPDQGDAWTSVLDVAHIEGLVLRDKPAVQERRDAIVAAHEAWCRDHHRAERRAGFVPLDECARAIGRALRSLRAGMVETPSATLAGARVKARAASRALVEVDDDPADLVGIVRGYVAEREPTDPDALAWDVVGSVLAAAPVG